MIWRIGIFVSIRLKLWNLNCFTFCDFRYLQFNLQEYNTMSVTVSLDMSRCSFLSNAYFPWPPLLMLSLVIIYSSWLLYPVVIQSLKCNVNCRASYYSRCRHYVRVIWVGQGTVSFVGMSVTLVLASIGSILLHFLVCTHLLRGLSLNGGYGRMFHIWWWRRRTAFLTLPDNLSRTCHFPGWDSVVGLSTPGIESQWERDFLHPSIPALGPIKSPV
jgi:hypothetical protein